MKRLLRVVLVLVTPILMAAVCMVGTPPTPESTRVVIKGILGGIDMAQDILIVTPFATFTPTLTLTPTPTLTPTVAGKGDQGDGTAGGGDGGDGTGDQGQGQAGGPGALGSPTLVALVTLTASPSPIATTTPSATASPSAMASPSASPTPSATATLIPTLTPTAPSSGGGGGGGGGGGPAPPPPSPTNTPIPPLPVISFSSTVYNVGEGGFNAIITVVLNVASSQPVSVNFSTSNGTAFAPNDYTPTNGTLSFSLGQTSQSFSVPITQDIVDDPDIETVLLALSGPSNGTLGTSSATLQISDDDPLPRLQFTVPITTNTVFENIPPPSFDVNLDRPTGKGITFTYQPENPNSGTATVNIDYINTFNVDTFAPDITGVSPTALTITWSGILDDVIPEPVGETLIMELGSNPTAYTLGLNFTTTLVILSDE